MANKKAKNNLSAKAYAKENKFKDSDADGLSDEDEINLGTNPFKSDTDGDGVNDNEEVNVYGTDPLNPDTDGDGIKDGDEIKRGYNPKGPGLLNNLFIPSVFNHFRPQSLHPKRIIFYSLSAVLFKVILVATVMILPIEAWLTPNILEEQSRKVISLTNLIRKNLSLALLSESQRLDQAAYDKAEDMLLNQYFSHTGPNHKTLADWLAGIKYNYAAAGENLAMGFASPEEVVNGWTRSQTHYQNMIDPDFKEIGVGMVSGLYEKIDTTLVAQYFGMPIGLPTGRPAGPAGPPAQIASTTEILGEKVQETAVVKLEPDFTPLATTSAASTEPSIAEELVPSALELPVASVVELPQIDQAKSRLYVDRPQGRDESIVRAEVYLSSDAVSAQVNFNNYFINLKPVAGEPGRWTGQTIIFKQGQEQIFNPVVLASLTAENQAGVKATEDLTWDNIRPAKTTLLKQYYFIKQHQSPYITPLFDITSIFYKIILIVALIALGLNIFIHIRKQQPRVILSALGLIALLVILIIL